MIETADLGVQRVHEIVVGVGVVAHIHAESGQLGHSPIDDADQVSTASVADGETQLTTGLRHHFQNGHVMTALGCHSRCFESSGSRARST